MLLYGFVLFLHHHSVKLLKAGALGKHASLQLCFSTAVPGAIWLYQLPFIEFLMYARPVLNTWYMVSYLILKYSEVGICEETEAQSSHCSQIYHVENLGLQSLLTSESVLNHHTPSQSRPWAMDIYRIKLEKSWEMLRPLDFNLYLLSSPAYFLSVWGGNKQCMVCLKYSVPKTEEQTTCLHPEEPLVYCASLHQEPVRLQLF